MCGVESHCTHASAFSELMTIRSQRVEWQPHEAASTLERLGAEHRIDAARAAWRHLSAEAAAAMDALRQFETIPSNGLAACTH